VQAGVASSKTENLNSPNLSEIDLPRDKNTHTGRRGENRDPVLACIERQD
jgi:hypothetical protein